MSPSMSECGGGKLLTYRSIPRLLRTAFASSFLVPIFEKLSEGLQHHGLCQYHAVLEPFTTIVHYFVSHLGGVDNINFLARATPSFMKWEPFLFCVELAIVDLETNMMMIKLTKPDFNQVLLGNSLINAPKNPEYK